MRLHDRDRDQQRLLENLRDGDAFEDPIVREIALRGGLPRHVDPLQTLAPAYGGDTAAAAGAFDILENLIRLDHDQPAGARFQFERQGYFCADAKDCSDGNLVFNRTVSLRDSWAKIAKSK